MIPRTVTVNGVPYNVRRVPAERIDASRDTAGSCNTEATLILIAEEISSAAQLSTFLHEVGHASFYESGARELVKDMASQPNKLEELLVQIWLPVYRQAIGQGRAR